MSSSSSSSQNNIVIGRHHHRRLDPFQQARRCGLRENFPSLEEALQVKPSADDDDDHDDENDRSYDNDEISVGSYCSSSLNLSIGARAALNQHARHVAKYGLDGSSSSASATSTLYSLTEIATVDVVEVLVVDTDNARNISTVADTGACCDDDAAATKTTTDCRRRRRRLCSSSPSKCRLDEEWERIVDGDVSHISLANSSCLGSSNVASSHHHHHSLPRPRRRRHLRHLEPIWRIDADGHETYELQAVVTDEEEEESSSSIVSSSLEEHHEYNTNGNVADDSFYSQSTTDYFNSSLVWLLSTPVKNQAMQYHVVDSRSRRGDDKQQQQQYQEESFTASTTQHDDDDDIYNNGAILESSQKEGIDVGEGSCFMLGPCSGDEEDDRVALVDTSSENHHHQDSSADSLLEMFRRGRHVVPPEVDLALDKNRSNYYDEKEESPVVLEEIELSRISSSGEEELYNVLSPAASAPSPNRSPITRRCFHQDSPIWQMDSQEDDGDGRGGGGEDMIKKPLLLPFITRSPPSLLSSPIRERQQDLADCSFVSSTLAELNNSTNCSGCNSSSSSSSPSANPFRLASPPRFPTTTRNGAELVAGSRASSPAWSPLRCSTPTSNHRRGHHDLSLEPDLSALGLSPIAGRAADIAAELLRHVANHDSSNSNHSSSSSRRVAHRKMPTVRKNDNNRSINHEISYNHGISARSLTSLAASAAKRAKARVSLSPNSQQSRSLRSMAVSAATERVLKQNDSERNGQSATTQQRQSSFAQQQPISLLDIDTAHSPLVISPSNISIISANRTEDSIGSDEIAIPPSTSSSSCHKKSSLHSSTSSRSIKNSSGSSSPAHGDRKSNQSLLVVPPTLDDSPLSSSSSFSGVRDRRHYRSVVPFRVHMDQSTIMTDIPQEHDSFLPPNTMTATCLLASFDQVAKHNNNNNDDQAQQNNRSSLSDPFPQKSSRLSFI